jgi:hypothetical protein
MVIKVRQRDLMQQPSCRECQSRLLNLVGQGRIVESKASFEEITLVEQMERVQSKE